MAANKVNVKIDLDFISNKTSLEQIKKEVQTLKHAIDLSLDPQAAGKLKSDVDTLGRGLVKSFNETTGKVNLKSLSTFLDNNLTGTVKQLDTSLNSVGINGTKSFNAVNSAGALLNKSLTDSNSLLTKMGTTLMNTIRWNISASVINKTTQEFQKMYFFAKDLDRSLTNIRIVSGLSADNMSRFAENANKASKELRVSTIDYTEAALIFYQQGLNAMEVQNMTRASIIGGNITGESTAEMSNLLTAVLNGYKVATEDVLVVTDKLAAVGATTAADFYELATAMSKVSSMANAAGVPLDQLNAQIATIVSVTREAPESIGMSLKTIYGRMLMFKNNATSLMEDEDGELFGAPSVEKALEAYGRATGAQISLFKTTADGRKELRDLGEVIEEVGDSWDKTTDKTAKFGLTTALAGSRQQNRLVALFDGWDMYKDAVTTSLDAEGTSLKQNELYMESYEGKLKGLQAAKEELYMGMLDSSSMKDLISGLTTIVGLFTKVADVAGNMGAALGVAGALIAKPAFASLSKSLGGFGTTGRSGTGSELESLKKLETIKKTFGADEANRVRLNIKNSEDVLKMHQTESDLLYIKRDSYKAVTNALKNQNMTEKQQEGVIAIQKAKNESLGITNSQIDRATVAYKQLQEEAKKLGTLQKQANESSSKKLKVEVEESLAKIRALKAEIREVDKISLTDRKSADLNVDHAEANAMNARMDADDLAKQAERAQRATLGIQTGMMLILPAIATARDSSKSWGDVLGSIGMMMVPMSGQIISGFQQAGTALKELQAGSSKLGAIWGTTLGPMAAAVALAVAVGIAVKLATDYMNQYKDAVDAADEARSKLAETESNYKNIVGQLHEVEARMREISRIKEQTPDDEEELKSLATKLELLREEKELQQFMLDAAKEQSAKAAYEASQAEMTSEFSVTGTTSMGTNIYGRTNEVEELKAATDAFLEQKDAIAILKAEIADFERTKDSNGRTDEMNIAILNRMNGELTYAEGKLTDQKQAMGQYSQAVRLNTAELDPNIEAHAEQIKIANGQLSTTGEVIKTERALADGISKSTSSIEDETEAFVDNKTQKRLNEEAAADLLEQYEKATGDISTYNGFLKEMSSKEGLSAKSKQDMITKYQQFLPMIDDEVALRYALVEAIEAEEQAQYDAYTNMLSNSEEFFKIKIMGNAELVDKLSDFYGIDLRNSANLAEAKETLEKELIKRLSEAWSKYYKVSASGNITTGVEYASLRAKSLMGGEAGAAAKATLDEMKEARRQAEEAGAEFDKLISTTAFEGVSDTLKNLNTSLASGKGSKGGKSAKEVYKAFLDIYEAINLALAKNSNLLQINKIYQDQAGDDLTKKIPLMEEQIRLEKEQQGLIKDKIALYENELKDLEKLLSKEGFSFVGTGANRTIEDLTVLNGKTKEVEETFKKYMQIQSSLLPTAEREWLSLSSSIDKTSESIQSSIRASIKATLELEKKNAYLEIDVRTRITKSDLAKLKRDLDEAVSKIEVRIETSQDKIDRINETEAARQEALKRKTFIENIGTLQNKLDAIRNKSFSDLTEEQAKSLGLEAERTKYLEDQIRLQELQERLANLQNERNIQQLIKQADGTFDFEYVVDQKAIDDTNKEMLKLQGSHEDSMKNLQDKTLEELKAAQADFDEWNRLNTIQDQIEKEQRRIKYYQEEISDLNKQYKTKEDKMNEELAKEKERMDTYYKDMDLLTDTSMEAIASTFDGNWTAIATALKGHFEAIGLDYQSLMNTLSTPLPSVDGIGSVSSGVGGSSSKPVTNPLLASLMAKYTPSLGKGGTTSSAAAKENEDRIKNDASFRATEIIRAEAVIKAREEAKEDTSLQKKYLERLKSGTYRHGGKITETGLTINDFHGTQTNPEWIFNDAQLQDIMKDVSLSAFEIVAPMLSNFDHFNLRGSNDISQSVVIQEMAFPNVKDAKEIEDAVRGLSAYANQWANKK